MAPPNKVAKVDGATPPGSDLETRVQNLLSDSAVFKDVLKVYQDPKNRASYMPLTGVIFALQDYLAGKTTFEKLKAKVQAWAGSSNYSDSVNQTARANFFKLLEGTSDADLKSKAEKAVSVIRTHAKDLSGSQKPVDTVVSPAPAAPPPPAPIDLKKWKDAKEVSAPLKKGDLKAKGPGEDDKKDPVSGAALLSDAAVFGDLLSTWSDPANKSGKFFVLNVALNAARDFVDGNIDYKTLKEKLGNWESASIYKEPLSYRARTNMISLLGGVTSGPLATKASQALTALKATKEIDPPKVVSTVPVTFQEFEVTSTVAAKSGEGTETADFFKITRVSLAVSERNALSDKIKKPFRFFGEVYLTPDAKSGEVSKVNFKYVSAWKMGDSTDNVTANEVSDYMKALADAYRREVKFKPGTGAIAFRLKDIRPSGSPEITAADVTDSNSLTKTSIYVLPKNGQAPVKGSDTPAPQPPPQPKSPDPVSAPKAADPVRGNYEFSFSSGHPTELSRMVNKENANKTVQGLIGPSRKVFDQYLAKDSSLFLSVKATIEVDLKTGFVTKITFSDVKVSSSMTGKVALEVMQKYAESIHSSTRWVDDKSVQTVIIPEILYKKS